MWGRGWSRRGSSPHIASEDRFPLKDLDGSYDHARLPRCLCCSVIPAPNVDCRALIGAAHRSSSPSGCALKRQATGKRAKGVQVQQGRCGRKIPPASVATNASITIGWWPGVRHPYAGRPSGALELVGVLGKRVDDHHTKRDDHYREHRRRRNDEEPPDGSHDGEEIAHRPTEAPSSEEVYARVQRDQSDDSVEDPPEEEVRVHQVACGGHPPASARER